MGTRRTGRLRAHAHDDRVDRRKLSKELVATAEAFVAVLGRLHEREASPPGTCEATHSPWMQRDDCRHTRQDHLGSCERTSVAGTGEKRVRDQLVAVFVRSAVNQLCRYDTPPDQRRPRVS